ncbi:MAG TPA: transporter substrate-binding domain-containing protein [Burkholderiaceae bacterium]
MAKARARTRTTAPTRRWRLAQTATITVLAIAAAASALVLAAWRSPWLAERLPPVLQQKIGPWQPEPAWSALPSGPVLDAARQRGVLVVGVRQYPRPAPPGTAAPPEPDRFDTDIARFIARTLGLPVRFVGLGGDSNAERMSAAPDPRIDLVIAGARPWDGSNLAMPDSSALVPTPYASGTGRLVVLRKSQWQTPGDLHRQPICLAQGSPYTHDVQQRLGALARIYPSSIHAISAFMNGECQALAEDDALMERLLVLPEWRFYRPLYGAVKADADRGQIVLHTPDAASAAYVDRAVRYWRTSGAVAQAQLRRVGDVSFEVTQLQNGLVCHS